MGYEEAYKEAGAILNQGSFDATQRAESVLRSFADSCPDMREKGMALQAAAQLCKMQGQLPRALDMFDAAEKLLTDPLDRLQLFEGYAAVICQTERYDLAGYAAVRLQTTLERCAGSESPILPFAYGALARVQVMNHDLGAAAENAEAAVAMALLMGVARGESYATLSVVHEALGDLESAIDFLSQALSYMNDGHCKMEAEANYARLSLQSGDTKGAAHHLRNAVAMPDHRDRVVVAKVLRIATEFIQRDPETAIGVLNRLASFLENSVEIRGVRR